jgi:hypothetical protein
VAVGVSWKLFCCLAPTVGVDSSACKELFESVTLLRGSCSYKT